jgi:hypothetical protein
MLTVMTLNLNPEAVTDIVFPWRSAAARGGGAGGSAPTRCAKTKQATFPSRCRTSGKKSARARRAKEETLVQRWRRRVHAFQNRKTPYAIPIST